VQAVIIYLTGNTAGAVLLTPAGTVELASPVV